MALATLIMMSVVVVALPQDPWATAVPIALLFPVLLWIAARCHPVFAAAAAFIVTLAIAGATRPQERAIRGTLADIADRVAAADLGGPLLVMIGRALSETEAGAEREQGAAAVK